VTRSKSAGQSVSKRNACPSRDSQQMVGRPPRFENPSVIEAEFTTKLRLIAINPMSENVLLAQLEKGSF
jgi:hypothetical protein